MLSVLLWTAVLVFLVHRSNKIEPIKGKILYIHSFLLWIFLMLFHTSPSMLGWSIRHYKDIKKYFYVPVGVIPDWMNLLMWGLLLLFGLIAIFLVSGMAKRKEKSRRIFIRLLPIFYLLTAYEVFKGFYVAGENEIQQPSFILVALISLSILLVPFVVMYHFYNREDIKDKIFIPNSIMP